MPALAPKSAPVRKSNGPPVPAKNKVRPTNRLARVERRTRERRRAMNEDTVPPKIERRTVERRKEIDPTTCERDYSADDVDFMNAMDEYKRIAGRTFPTWSEVLEVVRAIGYERVNAPVPVATILEKKRGDEEE